MNILRKQTASSPVLILGAVAFMVVVAVLIISMFASTSTIQAKNVLESNGYVVLSASDYNTLNSKLDTLIDENQHTSYIWPETTNVMCTLTANALANSWSDWVELVDTSGNLFSSKITSTTHISDTKVEYYSDKNHTYMYQLAYGDLKVMVGGRRVSPIKESGEYAIDLKGVTIPVGQKVYGRCMCSNGGESCEILLRYHYH